MNTERITKYVEYLNNLLDLEQPEIVPSKDVMFGKYIFEENRILVSESIDNEFQMFLVLTHEFFHAYQRQYMDFRLVNRIDFLPANCNLHMNIGEQLDLEAYAFQKLIMKILFDIEVIPDKNGSAEYLEYIKASEQKADELLRKEIILENIYYSIDHSSLTMDFFDDCKNDWIEKGYIS